MLLHSRPEDPFKVPENFDVGGCSLLDTQHFFSHLDKRLIARVVLTIANKTSMSQTTTNNFTICNSLSVYHDYKQKTDNCEYPRFLPVAAEQLWQNDKSEDDSGDEEVDVEDPAEEDKVGGDHAARSLGFHQGSVVHLPNCDSILFSRPSQGVR